MQDLKRRIEDLRRRLENVNNPADLSALERSLRDLLSDAKNTPYENEARALFTELAQMNNPSASAAVRGLLRRAKIRLEMAGDVDDIDEAIDILTEALALNPRDGEVIALLQQAASLGSQPAHRVRDLFNRYGVAAPPPSVAPPSATRIDEPPPPPRYVSSAGQAPPEEFSASAPNKFSTGSIPAVGSELDGLLSRLTETYYAGDYQQTVDIANRILSAEATNLTAKDYRQKAEDNLIRGIVPDHRIPFEARVAYNRANSLVRAGNYEEAARLYREAREIAERDGILNWKDVEQALLDIQDLALARELIIEGDRLLANDNWGEALRKYEGALRVVPNDPQAEERIQMIQRVQQDVNQVTVQLNMLGGSLEDQVTQIQNIRSSLARVRQMLPSSQRLAQLQRDTDTRLTGVKVQLSDQARTILDRAKGATSLDDRLKLTDQAIRLMEFAVSLDPADTTTQDILLEARAASSEMTRSRQVIERAASLVTQNFDSELAQARAMLAGLPNASQDERYRLVVNDLMTRYMERAEQALDDGDAAEAQAWLNAMRDEPFRLLGRRTEIYRLESMLRRRRQQFRILAGIAVTAILLCISTVLFATRNTWQPVLFPTATPTSTATLTPTITLTPSSTPTATITPTASDTPTATATYTATSTPTASLTPTATPTSTWTWTPSPTWTPSWTPTSSLTPTATNTATHTNTPTVTPTPSDTPTITLTPSITPTPPELCRLIVKGPNGIFMREQATTNSPVAAVLPVGQTMDALERATQVGRPDGPLWYRVRVNLQEGLVFGWVRSDLVDELTSCPPLP